MSSYKNAALRNRSASFPITSSSNLSASNPSSERSAFEMIMQRRDYSWHDWQKDHEDTIWSLFWAITKTVEDNKLEILDRMEFSDFMKFCRKHTSVPKPPADAHVDNDTDANVDTQSETTQTTINTATSSNSRHDSDLVLDILSPTRKVHFIE